jgi:hypothetical protein
MSFSPALIALGAAAAASASRSRDGDGVGISKYPPLGGLTVFGSHQPYLGQERREAGRRAGVDLVVEDEQVPLRRRARGQAGERPLVQRPLGLVVAGDLPGVPPPCLQITPQDAVAADGRS